MISHKHKCIFIHIPKCAGSSIEKAFGIYNPKNVVDYNSLTGWCDENKLLLQHATPQQLIDLGLINSDQWNSYYKFIIYRNSWDKSYSDYVYLYETSNILGDFKNYLKGKKEYFNKLNIKNSAKRSYEGSHLLEQIDYFQLNNKIINYDLSFEIKNIKDGLKKIILDLELESNYFDVHINKSKFKIRHYSLFYNNKRKALIEKQYKRDIDFFNFCFDDKKTFTEKMISKLGSKSILKNIHKLRLTKNID